MITGKSKSTERSKIIRHFAQLFRQMWCIMRAAFILIKHNTNITNKKYFQRSRSCRRIILRWLIGRCSLICKKWVILSILLWGSRQRRDWGARVRWASQLWCIWDTAKMSIHLFHPLWQSFNIRSWTSLWLRKRSSSVIRISKKDGASDSSRHTWLMKLQK